MRRRPVIALTCFLLAVMAGNAAARPFGEKGQYIVTTDADLDFQRDTVRLDGDVLETVTRYAFVLAGDYTSFANVSFGVVIGFEGTVGEVDTAKGFRFGGRVGYVLPLGETLALWPRLGLSFANTTYQSATTQYTVGVTRLSASLPLMLNPYPQVLVGLAPTFDHDLRASIGVGDDTPVPEVTGFGLHLVLGFWFE